MKISVIIVSYHAAEFLEQTLNSVLKASGNMDVEIIISDNSSNNDIEKLIKGNFGSAKYIANSQNPGFAKANNLAVAESSGDLIVFLNPDTILPENFFIDIPTAFQNRPETGAAGVRMIDGAGNFLPESKRNLPGLWNSFSKTTGLSKIFPGVKLFSGYYRNDVDETAQAEISVLSGACFIVRKEVLEKTGGFDERFFMYAEDIDLSYRILKEGYKISYLGNVTIIHFKGETSIKDHTYYSRFYEAMALFVGKHYPPLGAGILKLMIKARKQLSLLNIRPQEKQSNINLPFKFKGDKDSIEEAVKIINHPEEKDNNSTTITVLCEGRDFSYKDLIYYAVENKGGRFLVHGKNTASVTGSFDKNKQGVIFSVKT